MTRAEIDTSPFVGLDYFHESHAQYFFGRGNERKRLISNLQASRLTLLYAASGVGKSSLLRAGVIARLHELAQRGAGRRGGARHVPVIVSTWRDDPTATLIAAVIDATKSVSHGPFDPRGERLDETIAEAVAASGVSPLVILDQFEDYFLYHAKDAEGERFADELARCIERSDVRANFLISIREDSYARIGDRFKGRIESVYSNYLHLDYLDAAGAEAAIRGPLDRLNEHRPERLRLSIEDGLVEAVLDQAHRHDDASPGYETAYLQLIMQRVWHEELRAGSSRLRLETLGRLGGAGSIVRQHLDEAMAGLSDPGREVAAAALRYLVTSAGTKIALTATALSEFSGVPEPALGPVLHHLESARIVRPDASGPMPSYELYHDLLGEVVADWRKALDAERERRDLEARLKAEEQRALDAADRRHKDRELRLVRSALAAVSVVVVLLAVAVGWALHERGVARDAQTRARSQALAASAVGRLSVDPELGVMLATAAEKTKPTAEAEEALRRALSASHIRGRISVGKTVAAAIDDDADLLATVGPREASLWRLDASGRRLAKAQLQSDSGVLAVAADGTAVAVDSDSATFILRPASGAAPVRLERGGLLKWVQLSADGRYATGTDARAVTRVWETRTGRTLARLPAGHAVLTGEFDPAQPRRIVAGDCESGALTIWRWSPVQGHAEPRGSSGTVRRVRALHSSRAVAADSDDFQDCIISVSRDGSRAVETLASGSARLWDLRRGDILAPRLPRLDGTVVDVAWSPDGRRFAAAAGKAAAVYTNAGAPIATSQSHTDTVNTVAFSRDGELVVTAGNDGIARVSDALTGAEVEDLRGHTDWVLDAAFAADGRSVVTVSADGTSARWAVDTGRVLRGNTGPVLDASFSPDGRRVVTGGNDGVVRIWDGLHDIELSGPRLGATASVDSVEFSPDGREIVAAGNDASGHGQVLFAAAASGRLDVRKEISSLGGPRRRPVSTQDGVLRVTAMSRRAPAEGSEVAAVPAFRDAALSPDGRWLLTTSSWQRTLLWDLTSAGRTRFSLPLSFWQWAVSAGFSPDGRRIVTAGYDGVARIFTVGSWRAGAVLRRHGALYGARFSHDGRRVLSYGADGTAQVWDPQARHPRALTLRGHTGAVTSGDFSPDGRLVVTGGADKTTLVWDARSGRLLSTQQMHGDIVNSVAFSPDGRTILSTSDDRTARLYPCETCASATALLRLAERRAYRPFREEERREFDVG